MFFYKVAKIHKGRRDSAFTSLLPTFSYVMMYYLKVLFRIHSVVFTITNTTILLKLEMWVVDAMEWSKRTSQGLYEKVLVDIPNIRISVDKGQSTWSLSKLFLYASLYFTIKDNYIWLGFCTFSGIRVFSIIV